MKNTIKRQTVLITEP